MALVEFPQRRRPEQCPGGIAAMAELEAIVMARFADMDRDRDEMRQRLEAAEAEMAQRVERAEILADALADVFESLAGIADIFRKPS